MLAPLKWLTTLSLDAPLVAVAWQAMLAHVLHSSLAWHQRLIVGLSVWLGYAADRWFDSKGSTAKTTRHLYSRQNAKALLSLWAAVLAADLLLATSLLTRTQILHGLGLTALSFAYTVFAQKGRQIPAYGLLKSCFVAFLIAAAALLFLDPIPLRIESLLVISSVLLLFATNCFLIRSWEKPDSRSATALRFATPLLPALAILLLFFEFQFPVFTACILCSLALLGLTHLVRPKVGHELARTLADLSLLTPFLLLPLFG